MFLLYFQLDSANGWSFLNNIWGNRLLPNQGQLDIYCKTQTWISGLSHEANSLLLACRHTLRWPPHLILVSWLCCVMLCDMHLWYSLIHMVINAWQDKTGTQFKFCCIRLYRNKNNLAFFLSYIIKKIHGWHDITAEYCQQSSFFCSAVHKKHLAIFLPFFKIKM